MKYNHPLVQSLLEDMKQYVYRYSEQPFTLASGLESNHYFNCKGITLHPHRLQKLAQALVDVLIPTISGQAPQSVGGLTLGADPICYAISLEYSKRNDLVYPLIVRKQTKDHGTKKQIEGYFQEVKTCLVVDDVITTGGSTLQAVEALRKEGLVIEHGICILDREEGGFNNLKTAGVTMHSLFRKSDFF